MENKRLTRSYNDRMVGGVCAGIARYFNIDPTLVRLAFVLMALLGGPGILLYIILWFVMPPETNFLEKSKNDHLV